MIIVPVKDGENIERALKKFKRKFEKTGVVRELRARQVCSYGRWLGAFATSRNIVMIGAALYDDRRIFELPAI